MSEVRTIILTHQKPEYVERMLRFWNRVAPRDTVFVAFGGTSEHFASLTHPHRVLIDSPRLKTRDHQREKQSYAPVFQLGWEWLKSQTCRYVSFIEYDHIPLVEDFHARMISFVQEEQCDVAGFHVSRIDGSSHPHYLHHIADPAFLAFWEKVSVRAEKEVVLTMFGSGSFWRREAFAAVANLPELVPMYLEIFQPTAAHHLGFRVRSFRRQNRFIFAAGNLRNQIHSFQSQGAWSAHPVKELWDRELQEPWFGR